MSTHIMELQPGRLVYRAYKPANPGIVVAVEDEEVPGGQRIHRAEILWRHGAIEWMTVRHNRLRDWAVYENDLHQKCEIATSQRESLMLQFKELQEAK
jgi:hypothetical protein